MTIPRKVQYNEALDSVNAILCQKIKITQPLAWRVGRVCYILMWFFFLKNHVFLVCFLQNLGRNYFWSGGVPSCKFVGENITHICYFSIEISSEKSWKKRYVYCKRKEKSVHKKIYTLYSICVAGNPRNEINHSCYAKKFLYLFLSSFISILTFQVSRYLCKLLGRYIIFS